MSREALSHRLSLRVESASANHLAGGSKQRVSREDSLGAILSPRPVRAWQAESVIRGLTERERAIVADIGRLRIMSGGQLVRLHFSPTRSGIRTAQRVLTSLVERRVLARMGRTVGGVRAGSRAYVYRLGAIGERVVNPLSASARHWELSEVFLRHALMVSECYAKLAEASQAGQLELLGFDAEPACWRQFVGGRGAHETLKPDAYLRVALGDYEDRWFLECDRGTENFSRIGRKLTAYVRYWQVGREDPFPKVLWVSERAERAAALAAAFGRLKPEQAQLFAASTATAFIERIVAGAGEGDEESDHVSNHAELKGGDL